MRGPDDFPVLMSYGPDAPVLARLELGEDTLTFELHYPTGEVGVLEVGFRNRSRFYCLAETGYTCAVDPGDVPMFLFLVEAADGKRYRWYVHTDNPTETFVRINAHMEAKAPPKSKAAVIPYVVQQAASYLGQAA